MDIYLLHVVLKLFIHVSIPTTTKGQISSYLCYDHMQQYPFNIRLCIVSFEKLALNINI